MASPVIEYTNLLHAKKSLNDPAVMKFKETHQGDANFMQQAKVVEWAFHARTMANKADRVAKPQPALERRAAAAG